MKEKVHSVLPLPVRFSLSIVFLIAAIVYTISPVDIIPDVLVPFGWADDIGVWVVAVVADFKLLVKNREVRQKDNEKRKPRAFFDEDV